MDKVKELMAAGLSAGNAIKYSLGMPVRAWARKHDLQRTTATLCINGVQRPTDAVIAALIAELGGTENEWRELLWHAMRPAHLAAS